MAKLQTLKRFVRGNRGTPTDHVTVKTLVFRDMVLVSQTKGAKQDVVVLNGKGEVEAAIKHLQESLALMDQAGAHS